MAYANPSTFVAGQVLTAAQLNVLAANDRFFHGPPTARVRRDAAQNIPNNAWTAVSFDTEDWDNNTIWSSTAANKLKVRTAGKYLVQFNSEMGSSAGSERGMMVLKNSTVLDVTADGYIGDLKVATDFGPGQSLCVGGLLSMTTSDSVSGLVFQNSGAGLNTSTSMLLQPKMSILWVSS